MSYYEEKKSELEKLIQDLENSKQDFEKLFAKLEEEKKMVKKMAEERQIGFPSLAKAYSDFFELQDQKMINFLEYSAPKSSELVREYSRQRRESDKEMRIARYLVEYYESIYPDLENLKDEIDDETSIEPEVSYDGYTEEELTDEVTRYLTIEEYRALPSEERNQKALDRFWKRSKSKQLIGKIYERYVGYLYEKEGYKVDYVGIFKGFEDLGRDIIAHKSDEILVIQCKNWSKFKTIHEKHIFQFFGTVFQYKYANKGKNVRAIFYSATTLSDIARQFATELKIEIKENFKMDNGYSCIKGNISGLTKERIYHLPFDQQYDTTKIEPLKGEFYFSTIKEAERAGFRRAFRHKFNGG